MKRVRKEVQEEDMRVKDRDGSMRGSCDSSNVALSLGEFQETGLWHALSRSIRKKVTDASVLIPVAYDFRVQWENCTGEG